MARCMDYGNPVKIGMFNSNCCLVCKEGEGVNVKDRQMLNYGSFEKIRNRNMINFIVDEGCD